MLFSLQDKYNIKLYLIQLISTTQLDNGLAILFHSTNLAMLNIISKNKIQFKFSVTPYNTFKSNQGK